MDNKHCRFCGTELKYSFVDLGLSPVSNEYIYPENLDRGQYYYPLTVKVCDQCFLVQTLEYQKPEEIFSEYKYFSSFSSSWLDHCKNYVDMIVERLHLNEKSLVCELACNDGYLLQYFQPHHIPVYGVEPAANVAETARKKGIDVEVRFFGSEAAEEIAAKRGQADLIIGNNVLAHVPDINSFVEGIYTALKPQGTVTLEFPHLLKLMEYNQFDTIYHEHFSYFSLLTVEKIFRKHGMKIYDLEELDTHGGSLRLYVAREDNDMYEVHDSVQKVRADEMNAGLQDIEVYSRFARKVHNIKFESCLTLQQLKKEGHKIAAFGAAAKGNTFLNYCGIGKEYIDFVADSSTAKQGLYLPGTRIPIVSPEHIAIEKPDYIVFLAWNLKDEFQEILSYTRSWGCKFITFIPSVEVF